MVKVDDPRNIQQAYDDIGSDSYGTISPGERAKLDQIEAGERDLQKLEKSTDGEYSKNKSSAKKGDLGEEVRGGEQPNSAWADNTTKKIPLTRGSAAKLLMKKGGPVGLILGLLVIAAGFFGGPATLFLNLTANLTINWDQQNITAERRSQRIIAKRLAGEGTTGLCGKVSLACRYEKPSTKQLKDLEKAGIKAVKKDGSILSKQRLIAGERPAYYYIGNETDDAAVKKALAGGTKKSDFLAAKDLEKALRENPTTRTAFRRAYNPKWVNWVDDQAINFLQKMGLSKAISKSISEAADADALQRAIGDIADGKADSLGDDKESAIKGMVDAETKAFAETASKEIVRSAKADETLMAASAVCVTTKLPGVYTTVVRNYRIAQMASIIFPSIFVPAHAVMAGKGTPKMTENIGNLLTVKGPTGKTAMDSGAIKYGLFGDRAAAKQSKTLNRYIPGNTGNSFISYAASLGNSTQVKSVCNAVNSGEAQIAASAMDALKLSNPAGWISLAVGVGLTLLAESGALDEIISGILNGALSAINKVIDWNSILEMVVGDFVKNVQGEEFGDMTGVMATVMANAANQGGNMPLTPDQKVSYDNQVTKPVQLAWAEEDRLNYSPLDGSNPNTFMGSILTGFIANFGAAPSLLDVFKGSASLIGKIPTSLLSPSVSAAGTVAADWTNQCPAEGDFAISISSVASGPLCDVQYGIVTQYINTDPEEVLSELFDRKQIDKEGEPIPDSDLANSIALCNTSNTYSLDQCTASGSNDDAKLKAYFALYQIDKRIADGLDNEPAASGETPPPSGSNKDNTGPCAKNTVDMGIYDNAHEGGTKTSIRLCAVTNLTAPAYARTPAYYGSIKAVNPAEQAQATGKALVNTRASGATYAMTEAAKAAGALLDVGSYFAFRSYEHQQKLRADWCAKKDCGGAARPGYSNHEMGLAIDFDLPGTAKSTTRNNSKELIWLRAHAGEFGFKDTVMPKEDWHWAYIK